MNPMQQYHNFSTKDIRSCDISSELGGIEGKWCVLLHVGYFRQLYEHYEIKTYKITANLTFSCYTIVNHLKENPGKIGSDLLSIKAQNF